MKENMAPKLTVLTSVCDGERYLAETVQSILGQTFADFEYIIVDDGSRDATWDVISSFAIADSRIVAIRNRDNIGIPRSTNLGLTKARGRYIARTDSDDVSKPERLALQVNFLDQHPEVGALGTAVRVIDGEGEPLHEWYFPENHWFITWRLFFENPIAHSTVMMRRAALEKVGGYNENMRVSLDYDLWQRLSAVTTLCNMPEILLDLRKHSTSITSVNSEDQLKNSISISRKIMSRTLGQELHEKLVRRMWQNDHETAHETLEIANLIYGLCRALTREPAIPGEVKRTIEQDAARRILRVIEPFRRDRCMWKMMGRIHRLHPGLVSDFLRARLRRFPASFFWCVAFGRY